MVPVPHTEPVGGPAPDPHTEPVGGPAPDPHTEPVGGPAPGDGSARDADPDPDGRNADMVFAIGFAIVTVCYLFVVWIATSSHGTRNWYWGATAPGFLFALFIVRLVGSKWFGWSSTDNSGLRPIRDGIANSICKTLFRESEAMAEYALANGLDVPISALQTIAGLSPSFPLVERRTSQLPALRESQGPVLSQEQVAAIGIAHGQMARLVAPATPQTLRLINEGAVNRVLPFLGSIRLVRYFEYLAAALLAVFILTAFKAKFSVPDVAFQATGSIRKFNAMNLVAAAGLGAAFFALYKANRYIGRGTYDQKYEASYWARFTLGIVAGVLLAMVIPIGEPSHANGASGTVAFTKPLLALVGGFSADVVYRILARFVETLETLVQGPSKDSDVAQADSTAGAPTKMSQTRSELSGELLRLEGAISAGGTTSEVQADIRKLLDRLLTTSGVHTPEGDEIAPNPHNLGTAPPKTD